MTQPIFRKAKPLPKETNPLKMLEARKIDRRVGDRVLLDDVSVRIQPGQRISLCGANGSGKSLLLRTLAMLEPIDGGELIWRGQAIGAASATEYRAEVIYLRQQAARFEGTVREYLKLPFHLAVHRDRQYDPRKLTELLELCGLPPSIEGRRMMELSGGEAQLVALTATIQLDPSILLLDEPTAALSAETTRAAESLVTVWLSRSQPQFQRAFVWITHDPVQAERIATHHWRMRSGAIQIDEANNG